MEERAVIRCTRCQLNQFVAARCRKCKKSLEQIDLPPQPDSSTVVRRKYLVDEPTIFSHFDVLPSVDYMEEQLILEATRRTHGQLDKAARMIGMGRNTVYRRMKDRAA